MCRVGVACALRGRVCGHVYGWGRWLGGAVVWGLLCRPAWDVARVLGGPCALCGRGLCVAWLGMRSRVWLGAVAWGSGGLGAAVPAGMRRGPCTGWSVCTVWAWPVRCVAGYAVTCMAGGGGLGERWSGGCCAGRHETWPVHWVVCVHCVGVARALRGWVCGHVYGWGRWPGGAVVWGLLCRPAWVVARVLGAGSVVTCMAGVAGLGGRWPGGRLPGGCCAGRRG